MKRSTLAAVLLALGVLTGLAPTASAKDGQVTVRPAGITNESVTVKLSDLGGNDINNRSYRLASGPVTISGHSLLRVMEAADAESDAIDLDTIPAIEIDRPTAIGAPVTVTGEELRDPSAFRDGPPVFYEDNGATVFVMPGRGNSNGNRYRFSLAPVGITVQSGESFEVGISASKTRIKAGQSVRFVASVSGQPAGERLTYSWNFGDGTTRRTSTGRIDHTFRDDGQFPVIVEVTGASGSGRGAVLITVGKSDKKPEKKPDGNQGNDGNGNPGGSGGVGAGDGGGDSTGSAAGFGSGGTGSGSGSVAPPSTSAVPNLPAPAPPTREKPKEQAPADGLETVTGQLIDPASGAPVTGTPQVVEQADPAPEAAEQGGFGVSGAALTLAGVALLLGLGGFAELRIFSRLY
jgi:hypothetical protein